MQEEEEEKEEASQNPGGQQFHPPWGDGSQNRRKRLLSIRCSCKSTAISWVADSKSFYWTSEMHAGGGRGGKGEASHIPGGLLLPSWGDGSQQQRTKYAKISKRCSCKSSAISWVTDSEISSWTLTVSGMHAGGGRGGKGEASKIPGGLLLPPRGNG